MTVKEAAKRIKKSEKTVLKWCKEGLLRGAVPGESEDEFVIPEGFKEPYTERGKVSGDGIYRSIVKGVLKGADVFPKLYFMTEAEFSGYIKELTELGVIAAYTEPESGITYYRRTLKSEDFSKFSKNKIKKILQNFKVSGNINIGMNIF